MITSILSPDSNPRQDSNFADLPSQLKRFSTHLLVMKGLGQRTIKTYCRMISLILREAGTLNPTHEQYQDRISQMYQQQLSDSYICNASLVIEVYSEFVGNPIKLGRPKRERKIVEETLSEGEIAVILSATYGIRERAIVSTLAYSGIRVAELCNLKVRDIDYGDNHLRINRGKGNRSRQVFVSGGCIRTIMSYIEEYPRTSGDYLFTSLRLDNKLKPCTIRQMLRSIVGRTNIEKKANPHQFRHALACNMLLRGAHLLTIQEQLGHAQISTTMIYTRTSSPRVRAEYNMYTPSYD